ncbi:MAG: hypothetical protein HHAS10_06810 [Candidatus Altimarinota bacterium]
MSPLTRNLSRALITIWIINCALAFTIAIKQVWIPYMNAGNEPYSNIVSPPFDGTIMPILYVPDWTKTENQDKSKRFEDISISEYIPIPQYDALALLDSNSASKSSTILRYTYFTPYMGSYNLDYKEHVGGHLGIDIRAPIGTPVLSIANGVVVRTVEADSSGNKFIVVRHDNIPLEGGKKSLYSGYLHLSEILVKEGDIVRKGDMIGRVGLTGITTTPHLHFQIDTPDAPFHPYWHFTSTEARNAKLNFFEAINAGLNKDKAEKYTIHPLNFISMYLGGVSENEKNTPLISSSKETEPTQSKTIAAYISENEENCIGKRFSDVSEKSSFGKLLYPLLDRKCIFQEGKETFNARESLTFREALINTMRFYDIAPTNGTSHFLDIPIGDSMQGYALVAHRKGILTGSHAHPEHIMTREELVDLIIKVSDAPKNPSQIRIYPDVDTMNPYYNQIQDYAFLTKDRGGRFYPKNIVTRGVFLQMLSQTNKN